MPKTLSNRLEDLENEIHVMLTLQEPTGGCCSNVVRGASITTHSDGKVDKVVFEGAACQTKEQGKATIVLPSYKPKHRPVSSPEASSRIGFKDDERGDGKPQERPVSSGSSRRVAYSENKSCCCTHPTKPPSCLCGQRREAALKKCICGPKGRRESGYKEDDSEKQSVRKEGNLEGSLKQETMTEEDLIKLRDAENLIEQLKAQLQEIELTKLKDSEDLIKQLKAQLQETELQLKKAEQEKKTALNTSNEFKQKYDKLSIGKSADSEELAKLRKEKEELSKKLEKEEENRRTLEEKAKENAEKEKKSLTEKVEKIELHAAKSAKKVRHHSHKLATAVRQRDDHIRKLSGTSEKLADSIREKELENRRLLDAHKEMVQNFIEAQVANKKLADTNAVLVRSIKEFQEKLQSEKGTVQKLQKQIADCREESCKAFEEIERLKERLKQLLKGPKDIREMARLQAKLREAREREQKYLDEQAYLDAKMKEMQDNQGESSKKSDDELQRMIKDHKKLQAKFEELTRTLQFTKEEHQAKIAVMEKEFLSFSKEMKAKEDALVKQKEKLQADFDQLTEASIRDRKVLEDMIKRNQQQDLVIKSQQEAIASKDQQIKSAEAQLTELKSQVVQLNTQINKLKVSLEESERATREVQRRAEDLSKQLNEARELIIKKEKLISEQISKIEELRVAFNNSESKMQSLQEEMRMLSEEARKSIEDARSLSLQLQKAKEEKENLEKILKGEKQTMRNKVENLESTVNEFCRCDSGGDASQKLIIRLEQKVDVLQREAALQMQLVLKQKEQALKAAKFATIKLMETVCDFQEQVKTHKKVQYMLTKMLQDKEEELSMLSPRRCGSKVSKKNINSSNSGKVQCCNPNCNNNQ